MVRFVVPLLYVYAYYFTINFYLKYLHEDINSEKDSLIMNTILKRIDTLCKEKGWSKYRLAELSGLTLSTMNAWYHNDYTPKVESLERMCNAFGITLSQFFAEENEIYTLTDNQRRIVQASLKLNNEQINAVIKLMEVMNDSQ